MTQRFALISDIHGNALALEAVLAHAKTLDVTQVICLGDVATLGPAPARCLELVDAHCAVRVLGNHDAYLLDDTLEDDHNRAPPIQEAIAWARARVGDAGRTALDRYVPTAHVALGRGRRLCAFHGSPRSFTEDLLAESADAQLDAALGDVDATVLAGGHTHLGLVRRWRRRLLVNAGSVGLPFEAFAAGAQPTVLPLAEYVVLDVDDQAVSARLVQLPLSSTALVEALEAAGHPFAGVMGTMLSAAPTGERVDAPR